nr:coatomer subunit zeta-2 isoform X2 [Nothobranchius furzeri]
MLRGRTVSGCTETFIVKGQRKAGRDVFGARSASVSGARPCDSTELSTSTQQGVSISDGNYVPDEIAFLEGMTVVYKSSIDLLFYVVGSAQENELMLMSVLNCLFDSLSHILRKNVERRCLLENMEGVFLVVDEIIDGGVILESDPQQVLQKVNYRADENPLTEQSVAQVLQSAKEQIKWSILK